MSGPLVVEGARGEVVSIEALGGERGASIVTLEEAPGIARRRGRVGGGLGLGVGVALVFALYTAGRAQRAPADGWDFSLCPFMGAFFVVPLLVWLGAALARRRVRPPRLIRIEDRVIDGDDDLGALKGVERRGAVVTLRCALGSAALELASELDARLLAERLGARLHG